MRLAGVPRAADVEVVEFAFEPLQDVPGAVRRDVVDRMDAVAEAGDVPDRLLEEDVLVANEDDSDYRSSALHSSKGRTTPRTCPVNWPRAESPWPGSWTWNDSASGYAGAMVELRAAERADCDVDARSGPR